jgi:hypothetical protein
MVVERGRRLSERELCSSAELELFLPEESKPVRVLAKVVRRVAGTAYALKFVLISDVDRLTLMEHLDHQVVDSMRLLNEVAAA